jgi:hypothetical protein
MNADVVIILIVNADDLQNRLGKLG